MNRRNPRVITRTHWVGNHMITQRFRVRTHPFELVRVKARPARSRLIADILVLGFAALALGAFFLACFRIGLEFLR